MSKIPEYFLFIFILLEVDGDGLASSDVGASVGPLHAKYAHVPRNNVTIMTQKYAMKAKLS
jgi:hypothetical protein